jgi:hypothetical protein
MKLDYFSLVELIKESMNEIMDFSNIDNYDYEYYDFNLNNNQNKSLIGRFQLDDNLNVEVFVEKINSELVIVPPILDKSGEIYNIAYSIEGNTKQYKKTTLKELIKILKTVTLIVKEFINSVDTSEINPIFVLYSEPKNNEILSNGQKYELYSELLSKQLTPEYRISTATYNNSKNLVAFQKDKILTRKFINKNRKS